MKLKVNINTICLFIFGFVLSYIVGSYFDSGEFAIATAICFYSSIFIGNKYNKQED